jgi:DMSO/TMAO reductase YedYZ molybdopterin-dependent catalytic subunit/thiosulfate reductase cytochrome b subunit
LDFPAWLRATHILNVLFLSLLMRSGIEILSAHPKLYWKDDCRPGSEWLSLTRKRQPEHELWTSRDEEESFSAWFALPGGRNLGLGRHWHFLSVAAWLLTGVAYVLCLFAFDEWRRLLPTSWAIVPHAWQALREYASLTLPPPGAPYNALQQLSYAAVVFLLAPLSIATGAAMSPAVAARFPWYTRLFGGRQAARSLHFLALLAFVAFTIIHTMMVVAHGLPREWAKIVLGVDGGHRQLAVVVGVTGLVVVACVHILATRCSLRWPRGTQHLLQVLVDPPKRLLLHHLTSRQQYRPDSISPYFRVNGRPPGDAAYDALARDDFSHWMLAVGGLVEQPLRLSLADLRQLPRHTQVTKHVCIQGWTAVAGWTGVLMRDVIELCRPLPDARYLVFYALDDKSVSEVDSGGPGQYYETIDLELARHPQTLLAYAMNDQPLSVAHGAPLRLRVETQLGFKMVKWLSAIEFVTDYRAIGQGQGGWREDNQHYSQTAAI